MRTPPSAPVRTVAAVLVHDPITAAVGVEQVLVQLEPDIAQRVGGVVGVGDPLLAANRAGRGIERRADDVVHPLLPVVGTGRAAAGADGVCGGQLQPAKRRGVRCPPKRIERLLGGGGRCDHQERPERNSHACSVRGRELSPVQSSPGPRHTSGPGYILRALSREAWMSMFRPGWTILALALAPARALGSGRRPGRFDSASLAWDAGRYPEALSRLERLLTGPNRDTLRRPIALLTGEYYRTTELALDGQGLVWSRDGRRLAFTPRWPRCPGPSCSASATTAASPARTRCRDAGRCSPPMEARSPTSARLRRRSSTRRAASSPRRPRAPGSDGARQRQEQQAIVRRLETGAARVVVRTLADGQERVIETPGLGGQALVFAGDGAEAVLHLVASGEDGAPRLYRVSGTAAEPLGGAPPVSTVPFAGVGGRLVYQTGDTAIAIVTPDGKATTYAGASPAISADRRTVVFVGAEQGAARSRC